MLDLAVIKMFFIGLMFDVKDVSRFQKHHRDHISVVLHVFIYWFKSIIIK